MAWRVWSKLHSGQQWMVLLSPLFLLFLTVLLLTVTLPLPAPHPDVDRWPSRALSSAREFKAKDRTSERLPASVLHQPSKESHLGKTKNAQNVENRASDQNRLKNMKERGANARQLSSHASPQMPQFTSKSRRLKPKIKLVSQSKKTESSKDGVHTLYMSDGQIKLHRITTQAKKIEEKTWKHSPKCPIFKLEDALGGDGRGIRVSADRKEVPWFSDEDVEKMEMLSRGEPVSKSKVPGHGQVLQVAMEVPDNEQQTLVLKPKVLPDSSHTDLCQRGQCSLVKRTQDWFEVFAFHLDRVLGLNRTLPAVLRSFHSDILPYRYTRGGPRPVVWWDPDIQHLQDQNNDQNSVPLSYVQYEKMLKAHCGIKTGLNEEPCVGVHHSEWSRLALFDFLLQVNDRLDRYCCGFRPDPSDMCVENLLQTKCGNIKELLLVHILVRKADPSRLVFIDNAGRPQQSLDNLNFRLLQGIDQFPERAVSVLRSGCLESLLLRSLYADREFWEVGGGAAGLRTLIRTVEQRGQILLQHIRDKKLPSYSEL